MNITYIISDINKALAFEWIAQHLSNAEFKLSFILILQEPAALEQVLRQLNIPCQVLYYSSKKDLPNVFWRVCRQLRKTKPDAVHCHLLYGSLIGLTAAKLAGIKKRIYTRHHSDYHQRYFPKGIKWDKWCNKLATIIVAPSQAVQEVLTNYENVPVGKIRIIHHGFDLAYFENVSPARVATLKEKYNIGNHAPVVGVISRFTELKGIQYIIPAFQKFVSVYPDAVLMLFNANGDYKRQIIDQLAAIPAANYRLVPFETDLAAAYQLFHIFIQASTDRTIEAFGQTYVEALAAGVPSIFTLSGIAPDFVVDKRNAWVVPYKDSNAIYQRMEEMLMDYKIAKDIAKQGKKDVQEKFALNKMVKSLEELYARN